MEPFAVPRYYPGMAKHTDHAKGVKIRIPQDVAERFEALGGDWEDRIVSALRTFLDDGPVKTVGDRIADAVAPLREHPFAPHIEKAAKDFASNIAKDVAAAAGAAALAAFSAGMIKKDGDAPKPKADKPKG